MLQSIKPSEGTNPSSNLQFEYLYSELQTEQVSTTIAWSIDIPRLQLRKGLWIVYAQAHYISSSNTVWSHILLFRGEDPFDITKNSGYTIAYTGRNVAVSAAGYFMIESEAPEQIKLSINNNGYIASGTIEYSALAIRLGDLQKA